MASAGRAKLAYVVESTYGVTPTTPVLKSIPFNTGSRFTNNRDLLTSAQVQSTRKTRSSRLGVNQPEVSIASELQWDTFDELIAGGFGDTWDGGLEKTVSVTVDTDGTITRATGSFVTDGFIAGMNVLYDDDGTLKLYLIDSVGALTLQLEDLDGGAVTTTAVAVAANKTLIAGNGGGRIDTSGETVTIAETGRTVTLATSLWGSFDIVQGDNIYLYGTSGSDGWHKISSISANDKVLTLAAGSTIADETMTTGDFDFMNDSGAVHNGNTLPSYSFEESQLDVTKGYRSVTGCKVSSLGFSIQPNSMIGLTMTLMGAGITDWDTATVGASTTDFTFREPFDSFTGSFTADDASVCLTGVDVTLNNANGRNFCLFTRNASAMTDGIPDITGTTSAYFSDPDETSNLYYDETLQDYRIRMIDPDGNAYVLELPTVKYTGDTLTIGDIDVTESLPFRSEPNNGSFEMSLRRQPAAR